MSELGVVKLVSILFYFYFFFIFYFYFILFSLFLIFDIDKECKVTSCMTEVQHLSKSQITQSCDTNKNVKDSKIDDII